MKQRQMLMLRPSHLKGPISEENTACVPCLDDLQSVLICILTENWPCFREWWHSTLEILYNHLSGEIKAAYMHLE